MELRKRAADLGLVIYPQLDGYSIVNERGKILYRAWGTHIVEAFLDGYEAGKATTFPLIVVAGCEK